jgi:hypothetical protein
MEIWPKVRPWLLSNTRSPRVLVAMVFLLAVFGLVCFKLERQPFTGIGIGVTFLDIVMTATLAAMLLIRRGMNFIKRFALGSTSFIVVRCLWSWRTVSHMNALNLLEFVGQLLLEATFFVVIWEASNLASHSEKSDRPAFLSRVPSIFHTKNT